MRGKKLRLLEIANKKTHTHNFENNREKKERESQATRSHKHPNIEPHEIIQNNQFISFNFQMV